MSKLYEKLLQAQSKIGAIKKDSTNPYFKSKYFDINALLAEVKPVLTELGLVVNQPLDGDKLRTVITDAETGETLTAFVILPANPDPQKCGSIITYFRRYSLQSLLSLEAEDDDANLAVTPPPITPKEATAKIGEHFSKPQPPAKTPAEAPASPAVASKQPNSKDIPTRFKEARELIIKTDPAGNDESYKLTLDKWAIGEKDIPKLSLDIAETILAELHKAWLAFKRLNPKVTPKGGKK